MLPTLPRRQLLVIMWMMQPPGLQLSQMVTAASAERAVWGQLGLETWMPREPEQRSLERLWSGYVMPLALVSGIKDSEAEPHLAKQLLYSGIVKDLDFT